ncbi:MAG: hypothetical protein ABS62_13180 [Microbacterium sp. SCN 70-200]|uniref:type II toxin-antitoxin system VapC family toxin n=1 Tax=unclassified Microbacterium TaxID=2609290 RepID=UPI00086F4A42|nr:MULTISPECIES: type II toxin-antitoxin system VapC family toxin [unclassified Microbacterium]MBN9213994.1 type II toxin-antitoxin system VapC family toxin [Microbacterium sp.]ODT39463.1 MAG: hypothetical protein ABS62_13180 [Microbacterium sp. SCN 70-200]OJV82883.1 MAG: hypothetical protein BGO46_01135 [Microbacterium sp. 70-16]
MSSFLLDTHIWIWMLEDSPRLQGIQRATVEDAENSLLLSVASVWEMSVKTHAGRLTSPLRTAAHFREQLELTNVELVPIEFEHAVTAGALPPHHRDPFDRMIVAQAQTLGVPIVSADAKLSVYDVDLLTD